MKIRRVPAKAVRIEIVPLLDMMTLLMVVFVYAAATMTAHRALAVDLPAAAGAAVERGEHLAVTVDRSGAVYLEGRPVSLEALAAEVKVRLAAKPDLKVTLDADRGAAYGEAVKVLDVLRRAGAEKVRLSVASEPAGPRK
jgi:biopolymer transport protein ExbD